jgi:hypothetical protein
MFWSLVRPDRILLPITRSAAVPTSLDADEIGPTHSDITADCVAKAFGVPINTDPRALAILHEWVKATGAEMNKARLRLTRIPKGAARDAQKLAQAKREIEEMLERVRRAQSNSPEPSLSHGENRGSSPLGSANNINDLHFCTRPVSRLCPVEILARQAPAS